MDKDFFNRYKKLKPKVEGIPGLVMNEPFTQNTLPGTIGLELEVEATRSLPRDGHLEALVAPDTKAQWMSINDGSLRGEAREYIFTTPITVSEVPVMVDGLFKIFEAMKVGLNNSNRCSTHVHINMKGRTVNQITSVIVAWGMFERALIRWCGEERQTNHFCLSLQDSNSVVTAWDQLLGSGNNRFHRNLKYSALNLLTLYSLGSLEFRCGGAPDTPEKIVTWATFLDTFVAYVCDRYENPQSIAHDLSERGAISILEDIASKKELKGFFKEVVGEDIEAFNNECMNGFRNVQQLALGYPWHDWLNLIKREHVPNPFGGKTKKAGIIVEGENPQAGRTAPPRGRGERLRPDVVEEEHVEWGNPVRDVPNEPAPNARRQELERIWLDATIDARTRLNARDEMISMDAMERRRAEGLLNQRVMAQPAFRDEF